MRLGVVVRPIPLTTRLIPSMHMAFHRKQQCFFTRVAAATAALCGAAGCQSYDRQPLNLEAHRTQMTARSPSGENVAAFAARLAGAGYAQAASYDPSDGLTLEEAQIVALFFNVDLRAARLKANVARVGAENAGLWEDPVFEIDALRIVESVAEPWIIGTSLAFTLPVSGRLKSEKSLAGAEHAAELRRVAQQEWAVLSELRTAWLELSAALLQAELAQQSLEQLDAIVSMTDRLEQAGEMPRVESRLFRLERTTQAAELTAMHGRAAELQVQVFGLMGLTNSANLDLQTSLSPPDLPQTSEERSVMLEDHPVLLVKRDEYEVAEQTLALEIRKQCPDLGIGPAYENEEGQSRIGLVGSLPIPLFNRNRRGIAEALAERDVARAAFEAEYERLAAQLLQNQVQLESAQRVRSVIERDLVPLVDQQVADAQRMAELGELNTLLQLESLIRAQEAKAKLIESRLAEALAAARVRDLLGPTQSPTTGAENP